MQEIILSRSRHSTGLNILDNRVFTVGKDVQYITLECTARYAGFILAPAEGMWPSATTGALWAHTQGPSGPLRKAIFGPNNSKF